VTLRVKVIPRSKKNEVSGELADGTLKVHVTAPPEKGKANEQVCAVLAAHYRVPVRSVTIVPGTAIPGRWCGSIWAGRVFRPAPSGLGEVMYG
jgi:uncharacterized protein YggU (UPF0235/DUF167 family)